MTAPRYDGFVPGRHTIEAYGAGGFRFAEMSHRGSILALPSGVHAWKVASTAEITEESLAPLFAEPARSVDLTGRRDRPVPRISRATLPAGSANSGARLSSVISAVLATFQAWTPDGSARIEPR